MSKYAGVKSYDGFLNGRRNESYFYYPSGTAVDSLGNVYVADQYNHVVRKISVQGLRCD